MGFALSPPPLLLGHARLNWRSENGLIQDNVAALLESRDGFLWVGTAAGLVRFDGAAFDHYDRMNVPGFLHDEVQCLAEAADGAVWAGTTGPGLYRFHRGAMRAYGPAEGLPGQPIRRLLRDHRGILWAAPLEGPLLQFDGTRFQGVPSDATHLRIRALVEDRQGTLWVGTAGSGLWRLQKGRLIPAALAATEITTLGVGLDETLWVGTRSQGLLRLHEGRLEAPAWTRNLPVKAISALLMDQQGSLWVGLEQSGLFRRTQMGRLEVAPHAPGLRWTPTSLLEDRSGALWSGSEEQGLGVLYPVPFEGVPMAGADAEESVRMVCQDPQGTLWCVTGDHALGMVRHGRVEKVNALPTKAAISSIWPRRTGGLWVGCRNGDLCFLDQGRIHQIQPPGGAPLDAILTIYEDPQDALWVATSHRGLYRLAPGASPTLFPAIQDVVAMAGNGSESLYLASRTQGLGILQSGQVQWLGRREGLGSNGVLSMRLDEEGFLWIGTVDGLRCYRQGRFRRFEDRSGPPPLAIHSILEDPAHQLWLGTGQGVFRISRAALVKSLDEGAPIRTVVFDHHDGMPSRETSGSAQPAAWLTREGDLYFPTSRGLARLGGRAASPTLGPPLNVYVLKAESDGTVLPDTRPIQVPPGTHRFEVYYTATALTRAEKVRFRYRMEGLEQTWNEVANRRFSTYSNLPPGSYRFVVQAWRLDEDGPPQEGSVDVRVQPHLHQRPTFWVICAIGAAAFGGWLLRLRLQQLEARSAVLSERNRMAREIHDHLAQGFTGVLLQLEAAEAKLVHMQGDPGPILTRLDHARDLAAASLLEARKSVMALRQRKPDGTDLLGALRLLADRLLAGTDIQVELAQVGQPRPLRERLEEELLRMAQEMFTNALRHGKARWVRVVLQFEGRQVRLSIEDDGYGFDPSADAAGYGMRSIRESIKQLRGHLDIDSSQGLGSRITITIPTRRWRP